MLSPILFSMYIDSLLEKLKDSGLGCHVGRTFAGAFAYVDDIALVSPSLIGLRQMIQIYRIFHCFEPCQTKVNVSLPTSHTLHFVVSLSILLIMICI